MIQLATALLALTILTSGSSYHALESARNEQNPSESDQGFVSILSDNSLKDWETKDVPPGNASVQDGVLRLLNGPPWLHTQKSFADFDLRFDVRFPDPRATLVIFMRALIDQGEGNPTLGYGIYLRPGGSETRAPNMVVAFGKRNQEFPFVSNALAERLNAPEQWQKVELSCADRGCKLTVNGGEVLALNNLEVRFGHVGFSAADAAIEFTNIRVRRSAPISEGFAKGAYLPGDDPDLKPPTIRQTVKPLYTPQAMAAKVQGVVVVACVVKEDGTVGELTILRSLDSEYGLDHEAVAALKQWRFTPATLRGHPVMMLVMIELDFTLRR